MKKRISFFLLIALIGTFLPSCGPSQAQIDQLSTQIAYEIYSSLTPNMAGLPNETATLPVEIAALESSPVRHDPGASGRDRRISLVER